MKTWMWRACVTAIGAAVMWSVMPGGASAAVTRDDAKRSGGAPAITYAVRPGAAGEMVLTADAGVLRIEKSVFEDGRTILVLKSEGDEVTIAFERSGAAVVSGDTRVSVNAAQPDEASFGRARALLAQSRSARLFRDLAASIEAHRQTPSVYDKILFVSDAEMSRLEGDVAAAATLGRRLGLKRNGAGAPAGSVRPAACSGATLRRVQYQDCVVGYEISVTGAWNTWFGCYRTVFDSVAWYLQNVELWFCDVELFFRVEAYAMQFLRCVAVPI